MSDIAKIVSQVKNGQTSAETLVDQALERAGQVEDYHALLELTPERAIERAKIIDQKIAEGKDAGRLAGVPFVVKDNFLAFGAPTTAAAKMLEDFDAPIQATAVEKLEAEGAICVGKANLDAFAHGSSTENSYFGASKNAVDPTRAPGGSSGGSAVVVALDVVPFALGTDTGGSIRQPAGFNGVYGMKPTYGSVSRYGVVAMASGLDTIGCFARNADDTQLVMSVMAGVDRSDMTTVSGVYDKSLTTKKSYTVGVVRQTVTDDVQPEIKQAVDKYSRLIEKSGHKVVEVSMDMVKYALAMYYVIVPAEVSSNLARYDGAHYGLRASSAKTLAQMYGQTRDQGFMPENKRRIMIGSFVLSSGYFDAYYLQAQKARTLLINEYKKIFETCDFLLTPTSPTTAFKLGENVDDPMKMYLADSMTVPPSLAGLPALNVPFGKDDQGLPIGLQLIGAQKSDLDVLEFVKSLEDKQ